MHSVSTHVPSYNPHTIEWTKSKADAIWRFYAGNQAYDNAYFGRHSGGAILKFVGKHLDLTDRRVLDFGCGKGDMLLYMLDQGIVCQGLEFSAESADFAEKRIGQYPLFKGIIRTQSVPTPIPDSSIDVVLLIEVLEHLFDDQLQPTLNDIFRIVRPGGYVVATTPHAEDLSLNMLHCPDCGSTFHRWQHLRSVTIDDLSEWMDAAGFRLIVCTPTFFQPQAGRLSNFLNSVQRTYDWLRNRPEAQPHLVYIGQKP